MEVTDPFTYEPLEQGHIRLLKILAGTDPFRMECEIRNVRMSEASSYSALSYMWGKDNAALRPFIALNGKAIQIGSNLLTALFYFRQAKQYQPLWVDAICINQADTDHGERNHQVQMMGEIYSNAQNVLIWLGLGSEDTQHAIDMVTLAEQYHIAQDRASFNTIFTRFFNDDGTCLWRELCDICQRQYWTRTWIIQEVILAKDVIIHCGSRQISWAALKFACAGPGTMSDFGLAKMLESKAVHNYKIKIADSTFVQLSKKRTLKPNEDLCTLIDTYKHTSCSDIRDKVYALRSLAPGSQGESGLRVDYSTSLVELYFEALRLARPFNLLKFAPSLLRILNLAREQLTRVVPRQDQGVIQKKKWDCFKVSARYRGIICQLKQPKADLTTDKTLAKSFLSSQTRIDTEHHIESPPYLEFKSQVTREDKLEVTRLSGASTSAILRKSSSAYSRPDIGEYNGLTCPIARVGDILFQLSPFEASVMLVTRWNSPRLEIVGTAYVLSTVYDTLHGTDRASYSTEARQFVTMDKDVFSGVTVAEFHSLDGVMFMLDRQALIEIIKFQPNATIES